MIDKAVLEECRAKAERFFSEGRQNRIRFAVILSIIWIAIITLLAIIIIKKDRKTPSFTIDTSPVTFPDNVVINLTFISLCSILNNLTECPDRVDEDGVSGSTRLVFLPPQITINNCNQSDNVPQGH